MQNGGDASAEHINRENTAAQRDEHDADGLEEKTDFRQPESNCAYQIKENKIEDEGQKKAGQKRKNLDRVYSEPRRASSDDNGGKKNE